MSDFDLQSQRDHTGRPLRVATCRCGQKYLISEDQQVYATVCHSCGEGALLTRSVKPASPGGVDLAATTHSLSSLRIATPSCKKQAPPRMTAAKLLLSCIGWCKLHGVEVAASLVVHAAAALVMLSILLEHQRVPEQKPLSARVESGDPEVSDLEQVVMAEPANPGSSSSEIINSLPQLTASLLPVTDTFSSEMPELRLPAPAEENSNVKSKSGSSKRGRGRGKGDKDGDGHGGTSFFGKTLAVDSIAYVIDASGSMQGARFRRARQELVKALKEMRPEQQFYIVFYTDQTYPLYWPNSVAELQAATPFNLQKTGLWLEKAQTSGGTEPQQAMRIALALKPDVVFLLSDGDIPAATRAIVLQENARSVIHTIALGSNKGAVVMNQIAAENNGEFKFIPD